MEPQSQPQHASIRSRAGCLTCRTKKVKCDERRSTCGRCNRLRLSCEWQSASTRQEKENAKARLKARVRQTKILPNLHQVEPQTNKSPPQILRTAEIKNDIVLPVVENSSILVEDIGVSAPYDQTIASFKGWENWYQDLGFPTDYPDINSFAVQSFENEPLSGSRNPLMDMDLELFSEPSTFEAHVPSWLPKISSPLNALNPCHTSHNIVLSPSFEMTAKEDGALYHYKSFLALATTSKSVPWSTHMVMLRHGSKNPMVMHLLMAASLMDLAAFQDYDEETCSAARQHFRAGAYLLMETMGSGEELDHVNVLIAFFFLYQYMSKQKVVDPNAITQLSKTLCDHIRKYNLDAQPAGSLSLSSTSMDVSVASALPREKREIIARLIIWLFYADVFSAVRGYGGIVAKHLRTDPELTSDLYQCSTMTLESSWGKDYPESEILDDIENGPILKFLYDVMTLYSDVNEAYELPRDQANEAANRVETKILRLEEKSRILFRVTTTTMNPRSRFMINADFMVSYFYALRVYKFRCFLPSASSFSAVSPPPAVLASMNAILRIAQRAYSTPHNDTVIEQFQWALFMAGIETQDPIYREWVMGKLHGVILKTAFDRVCELQKAGRRVSIPAIRRIMRGANDGICNTEDQSVTIDGLGNYDC